MRPSTRAALLNVIMTTKMTIDTLDSKSDIFIDFDVHDLFVFRCQLVRDKNLFEKDKKAAAITKCIKFVKSEMKF